MTYQNQITHIQTVSPRPIDLSLERIRAVANKMHLQQPTCPVMTVGGTNGKGTMVATLEQIYLQQHYKTAVFTSPHIHLHTELFRLNGQDISQQQLIDALKSVEAHRGSILLTEYEFLMLTGLIIFKKTKPDIILLEVGMGGRDDVTNIIDPDLAIITNVALDHCQWLGNDRESIGAIKAGIFRKNIPLLFAEKNPPQSVINTAKYLNTPLHIVTEDTALFAAQQLQHKLPITTTKSPDPSSLKLPGRFQIINTPTLQIHDVGHNPAAADYLVNKLKRLNHKGPIKAIFSMFGDKDIVATVKPLKKLIDAWHIAELSHPRKASISQLQSALTGEIISTYDSIADAYQQAIKKQQPNELLLCFGSFQVLKEIDLQRLNND
jgi:dihydrofolate synthase/folylpolyglutamate synthase